MLQSLCFWLWYWWFRCTAADAPTVAGAATNTRDGNHHHIQQDYGRPAGKHAEFNYKINGGADQSFSAAALNADTTKIDLTTSGAVIAHVDIVTVSYAASTCKFDR